MWFKVCCVTQTGPITLALLDESTCGYVGKRVPCPVFKTYFSNFIPYYPPRKILGVNQKVSLVRAAFSMRKLMITDIDEDKFQRRKVVERK